MRTGSSGFSLARCRGCARRQQHLALTRLRPLTRIVRLCELDVVRVDEGFEMPKSKMHPMACLAAYSAGDGGSMALRRRSRRSSCSVDRAH